MIKDKIQETNSPQAAPGLTSPVDPAKSFHEATLSLDALMSDLKQPKQSFKQTHEAGEEAPGAAPAYMGEEYNTAPDPLDISASAEIYTEINVTAVQMGAGLYAKAPATDWKNFAADNTQRRAIQRAYERLLQNQKLAVVNPWLQLIIANAQYIGPTAFAAHFERMKNIEERLTKLEKEKQENHNK